MAEHYSSSTHGRPPSSALPSPRLQQKNTYDLFQLLLPDDHAPSVKGKSGVWEKHFQSQQQQQPSRPQTGRRVTNPTTHTSTTGILPLSPRRLVAGIPAALTPRCKSAGVPRNLTPRRSNCPQSPLDYAHHTERLPQSYKRPLAATISPSGSTLSPTKGIVGSQYEEPPQSSLSISLEVNPRAREGVEVKACMLAYKHKLDVDALQRLKEQAQQQIERARLQKLVTQASAIDDGSELETAKHKTSFLLRHFFSLETEVSPQQERLLYDIVEDWSCAEGTSSLELSKLWTSITNHIEQSYILRRKLVPKSDPDGLSIAIALDCLKKLTLRLPEYQRVLNVVLCIVESGLYVQNKTCSNTSVAGICDEADQELSEQQPQSPHERRFYFEQCRDLTDTLQETRALMSQIVELHSLQAKLSVREQIASLLPQLSDNKPLEKEELFLTFLHSNMETLACLACGELLKHFFQHENVEKKRFFYAMLMQNMSAGETQRVLQEIANTHLTEFRAFLQENMDAMDAILMDAAVVPTSSTKTSKGPSANRAIGESYQRSTTSQPLFQRLIERHPSEFAAILWQSPFLTAHIFQDSQYLVARILEQNIFLVSQVLIQRQDVLLALLNHTLKDSTAVLEEFLHNHPRGFTDLLVNRPAALADAVKANPLILSELLTSSRTTVTKVLLSTPSTLSHILTTTPELLAQVLRDDASLLRLAFSLVPHLLSETLEKHPEFFLDIAHRKPVLVTRLFAKYPDLLMGPLESNPTLFSNFLVYHRDVLPDLSAPDFNPMLFQLESKKFETIATQTDKNLAKFSGKLRIRERLELQEREMLALTRQTKASTPSMASAVAGIVAGPDMTVTSPTRAAFLHRRDSAKMQQAQTQAQAQTGGSQAEPMSTVQHKDSTKAPNQRSSLTELPIISSSSSQVTESLILPILTPTEVVQEIARIYIQKIRANTVDDFAARTRQSLVTFIKDSYLRDLGFKALAQKKLTQLLVSAKHLDHTQEKMRIKWFMRFANAIPKARTHRVALDFYLLVLQKIIPLDQLQFRLEDEPYLACLIAYPVLKELVDDPLVSRLMVDKEQRQQLLMLQTSERETLGTPGVTTARCRDSALPPQLQQSAAMATLHVDDILDSVMNVWLQFQTRVREEWLVLFQRINPDGSGVLHYSAFTALVRTKLPLLDDRQLMKTFHTCGEENELGEFALLPEDFSLAMFVLEEQEALRQFSPES